MIKQQNIVFILITLIIQCCISIAEAYDNNFVHQMINGNAVQQSIKFQQTIKNVGFKDIYDSVNKKEIWQWFYDGAKLEDETVCRSRNHFHDSLKSWDSAGLNNIAINTLCVGVGENFRVNSSIVWAQKQPGLLFTKNFWSWPRAREYYYNALTKCEKGEREVFFAQTFRALGQVMHLLADSSVPAHVRNDIHVFPFTIPGIGTEVGGQTYESWAQTKWSKLTYSGFTVDQSIFNQAISDASAPIPISALWDQDKYKGTNPDITKSSNIGLAEYTNANFFSEDTIFTDYPHPARENTNFEDFGLLPITVVTTPGDINHNTFYIKGYGKNHLAGMKYFAKEIMDSPNVKYQLSLLVDNRCYEEYAQNLIPRAVGYSAGLLNYFFRGDIKLVYETDANPGYVIVNNINEDMKGTFKILYDNVRDERIELWNGNLTLNASSKSSKINFPILNDAKEPGKYILVFKGKLGNEEEAVVGNISGRTLEITAPDQYVYSIIDVSQSPLQFTEIRAKVKNINPAEEIQNGTLYAIAKYRISATQQEFSYSISTPISISALSSTSSAEFTFNFTNRPIPISISDLYLQVIFKGRIGSEDNAVAIGLKDISEPTPIDLFNNMDMVCINGSWYIAGSPETIAQIDTNHNGIAEEWDVYPHDLKDIYLKISPISDLKNASPADYNLYIPRIKAGDLYRAYVLSDYQLNHSDYVTAVPTVQDDNNNWNHTQAIMKGKWAGFAVKNQEEYHGEQEVCAQFKMDAPCIIRYSPDFYSFRGKKIWGAAGVIFDNPKYPQNPSDSNCSWELLK